MNELMIKIRTLDETQQQRVLTLVNQILAESSIQNSLKNLLSLPKEARREFLAQEAEKAKQFYNENLDWQPWLNEDFTDY